MYSKSFDIAKKYLGKQVEVTIEIPKGQSHAEYKKPFTKLITGI